MEIWIQRNSTEYVYRNIKVHILHLHYHTRFSVTCLRKMGYKKHTMTIENCWCCYQTMTSMMLYTEICRWVLRKTIISQKAICVATVANLPYAWIMLALNMHQSRLHCVFQVRKSGGVTAGWVPKYLNSIKLCLKSKTATKVDPVRVMHQQ